MADKLIIKIVKRYIAVLRDAGIPVSAAYLFGSQVRESAAPESDIDLLILSPIFDQDRLKRAWELWKFAYLVDSRIEPIAAGEQAFRTDRVTPIYEIARSEGLKITP